jgi:hypothetical protein
MRQWGADEREDVFALFSAVAVPAPRGPAKAVDDPHHERLRSAVC